LGEAIGHFQEALADGLEIFQALFDAEILLEVVGADFVAQEGGELLVLFDERVFEIMIGNCF
jgi:hypothetical protein